MKEIKRQKWVDHTGKKFGMLTILGDAEPLNNGKRLQRKVRCMCDCGRETTIYLAQLKPGRVSSCGCNRNKFPTTHKMSKTRTYRIWWGMVCRGTGTTSQKNYADKGIKVCKRWLKFENFLADMGERPHPKDTLERVNNLKGYSPSNCIWASYHTQSRNRCNNYNVTYQGETMCLTDLALKVGMDLNTLRKRLETRGVEDAVSMVIQRRPIIIDGVSIPLKQAARQAGISYATVSNRLDRGWTLEDALKTPPASRPKRFVVLEGMVVTVSEASRRLGVSKTSLTGHLDAGKSMTEIKEYYANNFYGKRAVFRPPPCPTPSMVPSI